MWKRPSLFYWVTHQKYSKEEFAALLEGLKVEKGSGNLPWAWQCYVRGLLRHLHWEKQAPCREMYHRARTPPAHLHWFYLLFRVGDNYRKRTQFFSCLKLLFPSIIPILFLHHKSVILTLIIS